MNWKEVLAAAFLPTIEGLGESQLEVMLTKLREAEADPADFDLDLKGTFSLFTRLERFAETTKTKIDDMIAETVLDAVKASAETFGVDLPA